MTTLLKIEANRDNALASTGPRTAEGRAIVSGNAIRHGLLSWKPVIPGLENPEDWETHLELTMESLAPVGHTETLLAERAALLLWRLGRVARYERDATAVALEHAETRKRPKLEDAERSIVAAQAVLTLAEELRTLPPETELNPDAAAKVLAIAPVRQRGGLGTSLAKIGRGRQRPVAEPQARRCRRPSGENVPPAGTTGRGRAR